MRCITKLGNRKIYRHKKRKFPKWWKLPRSNKKFKKRRRNKKIFVFTFLNRSRHHREPPDDLKAKKRKNYTRRKRTSDFMAWKLNTPSRLLHNERRFREHAISVLPLLTPLQIVKKSPQLAVRRINRIMSLINLGKLLNRPRRKNSTILNRSVILADSKPSSLLVKTARYTTNFINLAKVKRYRNRSIFKLSRLDKRTIFAHRHNKYLESKLQLWHNDAANWKNRAHVFGTEYFSGYWKRGTKTK